jgi:hypothetical protein
MKKPISEKAFARASGVLRPLLILISIVSLLPNALPNASLVHSSGPSRKDPKENNKERLKDSIARLPLAFERNEGQANGSVKFIARGADSNIYFTPTEVAINLVESNTSSRGEPSKQQSSPKPAFPHNAGRNDKHSPEVIRMKLVDSSGGTVTGVNELGGTVNYFIGRNPKDWHTDIRTYRQLKYEHVYPGVDQIFYGNNGQLEYDFLVSPRANPAAIRFEFKGQNDLAVDSSGDLVLRSKHSQTVRLRKPFAYQEIGVEKREVSAKYIIKKKGEISFEIGSYDSGKPLVIDPVLSYSTYLGGSGHDAGFDVAVDTSGSAYVTGSTDSSEFSPLGGTNTFVAKFSPDGAQRVYLAIIGGSGDDTGFSIAVDGAGAAYVTGATDSPDFPVAAAFQSSFGGGSQDAFVAKLSANGSGVTYASYFGGSGNDAGFGIAVDSNGGAYITGSTDSPELSTLGNTDVFVTKLSPSGNTRVYSTILGGSGDDTGFDIAVDSQGNAYVVGSTDSPDFKTVNALQPNFGGALDGFVAKVSADGSTLVYSTYFGGSGNDSAFGIAVDSSGNAYLAGSTDSSEFAALGGRDVFVAKLSSTGDQRAYFTILGGSGDDVGFGIAVDSSGNAYVSGSTDSSNFTTSSAFQPNPAGSQDVFVAKLNSAGSTLSYSTYLGSSDNESGFAIALDNTGNAYVTGFTSSNNFPTASPMQSVSGGQGDAFVLRLSESSSSVTVQFNSSSYVVNEGDGSVNVVLTRAGDSSSAVGVAYATSNGTAKEGKDYVAAQGILNFAAGETSKALPVLIIDNAFVDGPRTVNIVLSNPTGATLAAQSTAVLTINDNDSSAGANPIDQPRSFVEYHYFDFLGRFPDQTGWDFWTNNITGCTPQPSCVEVQRINTSAAYFLSIEFQQTGYLVYRIYKASFGNLTDIPNAPVPIKRQEFLPETHEIGDGVIVNQGNWQQQLEANKQAFILDFVQRARFIAAFPTSLTPAQFVDKLFSNAAVTPSPADRNAAIAEFGTASTSADVSARSRALRDVADNATLNAQEFNKAFVLMQYFGYLRRNPYDAPESTLDYSGFNFWLNKLNSFNGNYINAEMVKAFISSSEYRQRFGP